MVQILSFSLKIPKIILNLKIHINYNAPFDA